MLEQASPEAVLTIGLLRTIPREIPHLRMSQLSLVLDYAKQASAIDHIKAKGKIPSARTP